MCVCVCVRACVRACARACVCFRCLIVASCIAARASVSFGRCSLCTLKTLTDVSPQSCKVKQHRSVRQLTLAAAPAAPMLDPERSARQQANSTTMHNKYNNSLSLLLKQGFMADRYIYVFNKQEGQNCTHTNLVRSPGWQPR